MMLSPMAGVSRTIGTSVVEDSNRSPAHFPSVLRGAAGSQVCAEASPSSLLVSAIRRSANKESNARRLLLQGPTKSGRSSLSMDLAYAIASTTPCRLHCQASPCQCVAVTLLHPAKNPEAAFPLRCSKLEKTPSSSKDGDFESQMRRAEQQEMKRTSSNTNAWSIDVLRRIRVHHVASAREIYDYLLSVQGKPIQEIPWGGIFLDDLDVLSCAGRGQSSCEVTLGTRMSQILAIAVDTVNCLERLHGETCFPTVLATTCSSLSTRIMSLLSTIAPLQLTLEPSDRIRSWQNDVVSSGSGKEDVVVSTWKVAKKPTEQQQRDKEVSRSNAAVEYALVRSLDRGDFRVAWRDHIALGAEAG